MLFRIGANDSDFFAPLFAPTFGQRDFVSLPNYRAYVRGNGRLGTGAFNVDVPAPTAEINAQHAEDLRNSARMRYGRQRAEVEQEISAALGAFRAID